MGIQEYKDRAKKAFDRETQWESLLSDAYELFLPNRNLFNRDSPGQTKTNRVFDSTAPIAIQIGASKLQENIAPIWSEWVIFEISREVIRQAKANGEEIDETAVKEDMEEQAEIIFDYINRSNFATQFYEMALDILIGTGTLYIPEEEDEEKLFSFHAIPQINVGFEEGPDGSIEGHWRKHKVILRDIERMWPGIRLSQVMQEKKSKDPSCEVTCTEGTIFDDGVYTGVLWIDDEESLSWEQSYQESSPFVTGRYSKTSGEVRGRGPALMVLPDVKSLNKAKEFSLKKAALDLAGMYTATDDGVMNPYNLTISPGIVLPVGSNNSSNPSIQRLDTGNNLDLSLFVIEDLKNTIKQSMFNDLRDPQGPVRTATEIAMENRELAKRIGSAYGRLQTEVLMPIIRRVMYILKKRGKISDVLVNGKVVDIKFNSPLARSQDMEDVMAVQQAVQFVLETAGPDQAKMAFKLEDFGTWVADKVGMDSELVRNQSEKEAVIKAGAEAAQAGMNVQSQPPQQAVA